MINDIDYQDYRELVCFERPATVLLHYQHAWTFSRIFLYDRFNFSWKNEKLVSNSNALADFLKNEGIVKAEHIALNNENNVLSILNRISPASENEAIVWPYQNIIGSSQMASTWVLQPSQNSLSQNLEVTSLRGDNFYLRKTMSKKEISKCTLIEKSGVNLFRIHITSTFLKNRPKDISEALSTFSIREKLQQMQTEFYRLKILNEVVGAEALQKSFIKNEKPFEYWQTKVHEGFKSVLLVEFFWPIQFAYQPFLVFWKYLFRVHAANYLLDESAHAQALEILNRIQSNAEILTNLGNLFGAMPKPETLQKFCKVLKNSIDTYAEFENLFIINSPSRKEEIFLIGNTKGTENITATLLGHNFLPLTVHHSQVKSFSLSEYGKSLELKLNGFTHFDVEKMQDKNYLRQATAQTPLGVIHAFLSDEEQPAIQPPLELPFVIKPNFGFASCHVSVVSTLEQFQDKVRDIRRFNRLVIKPKHHVNTGVLCEELIPGDEIAVDSITVNGKTKVFGIFTREYVDKNNFQDFIYRIDSTVYNENLEKAQAAVESVLEQLNYKDGPSHIEFRKDNDGHLRVLDAAFRIGGMGQMGALIEGTSKTPYIKFAVLSTWKQLGTEAFNKIEHSISRSGCFFVPQAKSFGKIKNISGEDFLISDSRILHFLFLKNPGESIAAYPDGADYAAIVIGTTANSQQMDQLLQDLKAHVGVTYEIL